MNFSSFCKESLKTIYRIIIDSDAVSITNEALPIEYFIKKPKKELFQYTVYTKKTTECMVCLSAYNKNDEIIQIKHCSHFFHKRCLDKWWHKYQQNCPCCRYEFDYIL